MTLVSSGEISIGGTETNRSINLELSLAQNANSNLGQTNFRSLAGVSSGAISLDDFHGKSASSCESLRLYAGQSASAACSNALEGEGTSVTVYIDGTFDCDNTTLYGEDCEETTTLDEGYWSDGRYSLYVDRRGSVECAECIE